MEGYLDPPREFLLPPRLQAVASLIPPGFNVADIGSDHGLLAAQIQQRGRNPRVVATEVCGPPCARLRANLERLQGKDSTEVRCGWGLSVLNPGEFEVVVLAGLGARSMAEVLSSQPEVTDSLRLLVLQPMKDEGWLRVWLAQHFFRLQAEDLVAEGERIYSVMAAAPGLEKEERATFLQVGPRLVESGHCLLGSYLEGLLAREDKVIAGLERGAPTPENWQRRRQALSSRQRLEEIYYWQRQWEK